MVVTLTGLFDAGYNRLPAVASLHRSVMYRMDDRTLPELSYTRHGRRSAENAQALIDRLVERRSAAC